MDASFEHRESLISFSLTLGRLCLLPNDFIYHTHVLSGEREREREYVCVRKMERVGE